MLTGSALDVVLIVVEGETQNMDTIFALSTARGKAGVAVFRLSGERAHLAVEALCGRLPELRLATLRKLRWQGRVLDEALILTFAEGASFTGERMAELQVHGGAAVIGSVVHAWTGCARQSLESSPGAHWRTANLTWRRSKDWRI
jgi:tRNA U34 5-carboxymethylaminomethyl modifying GTPase MnmE/TrmE